MHIHWAVYGEVRRGHDLIASSGDTAVAARLTLFTDQPGEVPRNIEWDFITSGFRLDDHYVLMRTQPDDTTGRPGMVRTYAAFLPLSGIGQINNLGAVLAILPTGLAKQTLPLQPLEIADAALTATADVPTPPAELSLARLLASTGTAAPLVWAASDSYLAAVCSLWGRLPAGLRAIFSFSFQFAPEHRPPVDPTLVVTLPQLANRWPAARILPTDVSGPVKFDAAQNWLAGLPAGKPFADTLSAYGIEVDQFSILGQLAAFHELVSQAEPLPFAKLRLAVIYLGNYGKPNRSPGPRQTLFRKMATHIAGATAAELLTLRNLKEDKLSDLIPMLQAAMRSWLEAKMAEQGSVPPLNLLEQAVESPKLWWSMPFLKWLDAVGSKPTKDTASAVVALFGSSALGAYVTNLLPTGAGVQQTLCDALPESMSGILAGELVKLAEARSWWKLHAHAMLEIEDGVAAVIRHANVCGQAKDGLEIFVARLGLQTLVDAACRGAQAVVIAFCGPGLAQSFESFETVVPQNCPQHLPLLLEALAAGTGAIPQVLEHAVLAALEAPASPFTVELFSQVRGRDASMFLRLKAPSELAAKLPDEPLFDLTVIILNFVIGAIKSGTPIHIDRPEAYRDLLNTGAIIEAINQLPPRDSARCGAQAFASISLLSDEQCALWLIEVFKRTQYQALTNAECEPISRLLLSGKYPMTARIVQDTVEIYKRRDVAPIHEAIRYTYHMAVALSRPSSSSPAANRLPQILVATALPLEADAVLKFLENPAYDAVRCHYTAPWPTNHPIFEIVLCTTGAGNISAQGAIMQALHGGVKPKFAFFMGIGGAAKDYSVGDVAYGTKVYYYEGGREDKTGYKTRPNAEYSPTQLINLAHHVAKKKWLPAPSPLAPDAEVGPAVIASGESVLGSMEPQAFIYQMLRSSYNDSQIVEMEGYGFMKAMRDADVKYAMVIRGVSDNLANKEESDKRGGQPVAAAHGAAFLFALIKECPALIPVKPKKQKKRWGLF